MARKECPFGSESELSALLLTITLAVFAGAGCGADLAGDQAGPYTVRDSAGIRIVEADWDELSLLDTVEADPVFTIGDGEDLPLNRVRAARLLPDGRVAIAHGTSPHVVLVEPESGRAATVASSGEGPAEVRSAAALHIESGGEHLGVYDPAGRRYVVFELDGQLVEERSLRAVWPDDAGPAVRLWGPPAFLPREGEAFYLGARAALPTAEGAGRAELPLVRVRGSQVDTVTRYRGMAFFRKGRQVGPVLLGAGVEFAASPAGVWVGDTGMPSVARWSAPGPPDLIVRWRRDVDRTLTDDDVRDLIDQLMAQIPEHQRQAARRYAEEPPMPERYPAFGDLLVDGRGDLWVGERYGLELPQIRFLPNEYRSWALFASDGTPVGRVLTPPRTNLLDARGDRLLGLHKDELGVETVRLYRLER